MMKVLNEYPSHVAIIMDGNGRWAQKRGLPRSAGHQAGVKVIKRILSICEELGIATLTLYAFSKENWSRPKLEIKVLMLLLVEFLDKELKEMISKNVRLTSIGNLEELSPLVREKLEMAIEATKTNTGVRLNMALNYGGRQEILSAVNHILEDYKDKKILADDVDPLFFSRYLETHDLEDPDLLIRTSGEERISNFLLWQLSYSEIYGTKTLWPDFDEKEFRIAINNYRQRERRYGAIPLASKEAVS